MAIPTIQMPQRPVEQQKDPKRDAIDEILRGLQVAQGITGIAVNVNKFRESAQNYEIQGLQADKLRRQEKGISTIPELIEKGYEVVPEQSKDSMQMTVINSQTGEPEQVNVALSGKSEKGSKLLEAYGRQDKVFGDYIDKQQNELRQRLTGFDESALSLNKAITLLENALDNPAKYQAAITLLARAITGPGVLTETEFQRTLPGDLSSRLERFLSFDVSGNIRPEDVVFARDLANGLRESLTDYAAFKSKDIVNATLQNIGNMAPTLRPRMDYDEASVSKLLGVDTAIQRIGRASVPAKLPESKGVPGVGEKVKSIFIPEQPQQPAQPSIPNKPQGGSRTPQPDDMQFLQDYLKKNKLK